uniref:SMC hinge domain-containing protein n=1 Tax=Pygocentrus nattereri TaxID=42514 RepID=A0AAR2KYB1_PYGNA
MADSGVSRAESSTDSLSVYIYDCRPDSKASCEKVVEISGKSYDKFLQAVRQEFSISQNEVFVLTTTDRRQIVRDVYGELTNGRTLHLLQSVDQELATATQERINYLPHYHTIVQSGQYEYYASEGQKALPYAFAELIDNALSATSRNRGVRSIDIRLLFDESQGGPAVVVIDNGRGMTSKELNNWAVYRLSKFTRDDNTFQSDHSGYVRPSPIPRSLNSDISYFGVGGKQAVFYIGQSVRIMSKPVGSPDAHEFVMSKEDFEQKEKNKEEIYSGIIRNRKPGDCSHVRGDEERFLHSLILEEQSKESFTAIVITRIQPEHVTYLKQDFTLWTRELAHIYHYYVHGIHGNEMRNSRSAESTSNIDIQISLIDRSPRLPRLLNLREIDNDMQTLYINSSVAEFEFKASKGGDARVEGLIRYHPFLYDRETYPEDPYALTPGIYDDDECFVLHTEGRGKRAIFECFWNGRLIPYSSVDEFEWCARPKKVCTVPLECYNRISGVLFTNDYFQVSTNKLTFMDLELQLRDKETIFTRVLNGQEQRVKINREFTAWLKECHERYDKQVKFIGFQGTTTRTDVSTKRLQSPWARFKAIHWDGKVYKTGQQVKSVKTQPILFGTIVQFLLYGDHEGDEYATGGHVQIALEPKELYNEDRTIPISKIDRLATAAAIRKSIDDELAKLPDQLRLTWPEGNSWPDKAVRPAGTPLGPIQVEILNKKGETMSRLPVANVNAKKLLIELKVIWHCKFSYLFFFYHYPTLGKYTLQLQTILSDGESASEWAGKRLPQYTLHFTIKESSAAAFVLGVVPSSLRVGVPFSLNLEFRDEFGHPTQPPSDIKMHTVKVMIPGLRQDCQSFQVSVRPGPPHQLVVLPDDEVSIENGSPAPFKVEIQDEFQNITAHPKLIVRCQLLGAPDLPVDAVDCSNTGTGLLLAKPIQLKTGISCVERTLRVLPSTRVFRVEVYRQDEDSDDVMVIQNMERIDWTAGDTLGSLRFKLYDEGGRLVPLAQKLAHNIKVIICMTLHLDFSSYYGVKNIGEHFYQVAFRDQHTVDTSTGTVLVGGVRFASGFPGPRELCFKYQEFEEFSRVKVTAGPPAKINLLDAPEMPLHVLNGRGLDTPFLLQLCDEWGNPVPDQRVVIAIKTLSPHPVRNANPASLSMLLWQGSASGARPPPGATTLKCSKPKEKEKDSNFYFRDKEIPEQVGKYIVQFVFVVEKSKCLWSSQIALNVVPNKPVKLVPESPPSTPVVSNSGSLASRILLDKLCLKIVVSCCFFVLFFVHIDITTTTALLKPAIRAMLIFPGFDGAEYMLQFRPVIKGLGPSPTIAPYNLPFRFYNDAENRKIMATMSKKKDQLSQTIEIYRGILETNKQLTTELKIHDAASKETQLKSELIKNGIDISKLTNVSVIEDLISKMEADLERIKNEPRRKCTMPDPFKGSPDVLGKIAHLAQVEDDDAAKVISWHLLGDMDCVVTATTAAAKKIYDDTQGRQQVINLLMCYFRPLPHIRNGGSLFRPLGNPVFVRDLLIFPEHAESCNMVFSSLVGDTILVDDLDSANHYRRGVQCPTLLTRQGERIRSNGKFGGLQNKAPPIEKLRGQVFGAPLPKEYHAILLDPAKQLQKWELVVICLLAYALNQPFISSAITIFWCFDCCPSVTVL